MISNFKFSLCSCPQIMLHSLRTPTLSLTKWPWDNFFSILGFPGGSDVKNLLAVQETQVQSLGQEYPWRRKWLPTLAVLPEKSHGQRAWWATVHGVAKSRTQLKRLTVSFLSPESLMTLFQPFITLLNNKLSLHFRSFHFSDHQMRTSSSWPTYLHWPPHTVIFSCYYDQWSLESGPQLSSISITWDIRNVHSQMDSDLLNQKLWRQSLAICILPSPWSDFGTC